MMLAVTEGGAEEAAGADCALAPPAFRPDADEVEGKLPAKKGGKKSKLLVFQSLCDFVPILPLFFFSVVFFLLFWGRKGEIISLFMRKRYKLTMQQ